MIYIIAGVLLIIAILVNGCAIVYAPVAVGEALITATGTATVAVSEAMIAIPPAALGMFMP